jgi:hypothetical protein
VFKILSGRLSAIFNLDGGHLQRYLDRGNYIKETLCEELILHDSLAIPTQDYLTACGLALIVGERSLITLLEQKKITFVRLRGVYGYVRGAGPDGALVTFEDPDRKRPQDSDIESSVDAGLRVISARLQEERKLRDLLVRNSMPFELSQIVDSIKHDVYNDLRGTSLWKTDFEMANKDLLALPGLEQMQVRVIGPGARPGEDPIDALLALARYNIELHLARVLSCTTTSSSSPLGDLLEIKARRITRTDVTAANLWSLLEVNGIPDLGKLDFVGTSFFEDFLKLCSSRQADGFRGWFHENKELNEREILREYVGLLREVPWVQRLPSKILRFAVTTGLGFVPGLGHVASFLDTFVIEEMLKGRSPRFFMDDLRDFHGTIKLQQSAPADVSQAPRR